MTACGATTPRCGCTAATAPHEEMDRRAIACFGHDAGRPAGRSHPPDQRPGQPFERARRARRNGTRAAGGETEHDAIRTRDSES